MRNLIHAEIDSSPFGNGAYYIVLYRLMEKTLTADKAIDALQSTTRREYD